MENLTVSITLNCIIEKKVFAIKKKSIPNKDFIMIDYYYDLNKTTSNVSFTENKIQSLKEMHRLRHFYMDASNLSAST